MPAFNVFSDGRTCPGSHRFPEEVARIPESFFQSYFSGTGDIRNRSRKHPDDLHALWEDLDGQTDISPRRPGAPVHRGPRHGRNPGTADLPLARRRWATWLITTAALLENGASATTTSWPLDGLYVQSQGAHLAARVLLAPCRVRGLAPTTETVALRYGPIPPAAPGGGDRLVR